MKNIDDVIEEIYMRIRHYSRINYLEKENNIKLKPNEVIMFLDNNCKNMDLNNLILVDKKTAFVLNVKGYSGYGELTKTMVDIISVQNEIKEMEKNG